MAIEQGSVALRSPEEIMKERVGRVDQFCLMMRKNPAVIGESLNHIMYRRNKKRPHSHEYFDRYPEDTAIAAIFMLQQQKGKFFDEGRFKRIASALSPQPDSIDPQTVNVLRELEDYLPDHSPIQPGKIIFNNPQDVAAFVVIKSLLNGHPNQKGVREIEIYSDVPGFKETQELVANINHHLSGKQKLALLIKSEQPNEAIDIEAMMKNFSMDLSQYAKKINKQRDKEDKKLGHDGVTLNELEDAMKKTRKNVIFGHDEDKKVTLQLNDDSPTFNLKRNRSPIKHDYRSKTISYEEALPFCSFLLNADQERAKDISRWAKKEGSNRIHFQIVQKNVLQLIDTLHSKEYLQEFADSPVDDFKKIHAMAVLPDSLHSKEQYQTFIDYLGNDIMLGDRTLGGLKGHMQEIFNKLSNNTLKNELSQLPIIEAATRIFLVDQIEVLTSEIEKKIRADRGESGWQKFPAVKEKELLVYPSVDVPESKKDLLALIEDPLKRKEIKHSLLINRSTPSLIDTLIFCGIENWAQNIQGEEVGEKGVLRYKEYRDIPQQKKNHPPIAKDQPVRPRYLHLPNLIAPPDEDLQKKYKGKYLVDSLSQTGLIIPITLLQSSHSHRVDIAYENTTIGSLQRRQILEKE